MMNGYQDLLKGLTRDEAQAVLELGTRTHLSSGSELFHLGDDADKLYLIERGRVRLTLPMRVRGAEQEVLVEERGPGQTIGWSALIPPYRFTLTAVTPAEADVTALSRDALEKHFNVYPAIGCFVALNLASIAGQRLQLFQAMWLREMQRTLELIHA
jgi:CRP/FNR family cyclic AMP-dependent transcriptional regulator